MKEKEAVNAKEEAGDGGQRPVPTIGMELSFTGKHLHESLRKAQEITGMPDGYRKLLFPLAHEDGLTQLELAKRAHLSPPTVSVTLKKMEADGLLARQQDEKDQRTVRVYLTEEGRSLNARVFESMLKVDARLVEGFIPEEQEMLRSMLRRMNQNLEGMNV